MILLKINSFYLEFEYFLLFSLAVVKEKFNAFKSDIN